MVFANRNQLALDYPRFPGGIFNPSLVQHAGAVWGIARCEPHDQAARNADKLLNFTPMQAVLFRLDDSLAVVEAHYDVRFENCCSEKVSKFFRCSCNWIRSYRHNW